jgi:hypothetical protein
VKGSCVFLRFFKTLKYRDIGKVCSAYIHIGKYLIVESVFPIIRVPYFSRVVEAIETTR